MSIVHHELEKSEYSLIANVSDDDMAIAREIYGSDIPILAVWRPHPNAKKFKYLCCSGKSGLPIQMLALPCFWPHFCCYSLLCGCCFFSNAIHFQAAHDKTIYIITEGRFHNHVGSYELPSPILGTCSGPIVTKGFYLDIDEVNISAYKGNVKPACEPCKCLMNPDDIPFIHIGKNYGDSFSCNSTTERDEIIHLVRNLKSRRDNAKLGGGGGGGGGASKKRIFVSCASDPTNFSLYMIESDNWETFKNQMKEKFALSSINSVQIAEVNVTVSSIAEISANDKLLIS